MKPLPPDHIRFRQTRFRQLRFRQLRFQQIRQLVSPFITVTIETSQLRVKSASGSAST